MILFAISGSPPEAAAAMSAAAALASIFPPETKNYNKNDINVCPIE